jgi:acyl-CoA synthetase (AMP-forming)/AMP-acid ligase II
MRTSYQPTTLVDLLCRRAIEQPDQLAYTFLADGAGDEARLTYSELDRQARSIAVLLQSLGVSGERVLLLYPPGLEYIAAFFGCLYAGAIAVPLYPPRHNRTLARILNVIEDAQPAITLTTSQILLRVSRLTAASGSLISMRWLAFDGETIGAEREWREPHLTGDSLAFLQYTSGSTGEPKGVMLNHQNLIHNSDLLSRFLESTPESYFVSWLPLYHDMGLIAAILQPLYVGFPCAFMSPASFLQRPARWLEAISRYKATISGAPNFAYDLCARKIGPDERAQLDLSGWRVAFNGAEPIFHETLERFTGAFADCGFLPETFYPCYGLAEATLFVSGGQVNKVPVVTKFQMDELGNYRAIPFDEGKSGDRMLVSSGAVSCGQRVAIVRPDRLTECPDGEVGEVWVSGPSIAKGYWRRQAETEQVFQAFLSGTGEGPFLRTGDLGFTLKGELFITGRLKDLIIIDGQNHYPQDLELTVERSHSAIRPGCCAAFSIEAGGREQLVVMAELDRRYRHLDSNEILKAVRQAIAEQHDLRLWRLSLIGTGEIPKTSSGKIQRQACRDNFLSMLAGESPQPA